MHTTRFCILFLSVLFFSPDLDLFPEHIIIIFINSQKLHLSLNCFGQTMTTVLSKTHKPHSAIKLVPISPDLLNDFHQINSILPSKYTKKWYTESLTVGPLCQIAFFNDKPVGAIRCSADSVLSYNGLKPENNIGRSGRIYIMTIAVLPAYRDYGIGTMMLEEIIKIAYEMRKREVWMHVWTGNQDAVDWYLRRGFVVKEMVTGYYRKMRPVGDAYIMHIRVRKGTGNSSSEEELTSGASSDEMI